MTIAKLVGAYTDGTGGGRRISLFHDPHRYIGCKVVTPIAVYSEDVACASENPPV